MLFLFVVSVSSFEALFGGVEVVVSEGDDDDDDDDDDVEKHRRIVATVVAAFPCPPPLLRLLLHDSNTYVDVDTASDPDTNKESAVRQVE